MNKQHRFECEFDLIQHSPLIHFQAEKDSKLNRNLIPRGTELVPLINRFLKKHFFTTHKNHPGFGEYEQLIKRYFLAEDKLPAPYKIRITGGEVLNCTPTQKKKNGEIESRKDNAYFGDNQMVQINNIHIHFFSLIPGMIDLLDEAFPVILNCFNLGTRKSKGFGSFAVSWMNEVVFERNLKTLFGSENVYKYKKNVNGFHFNPHKPPPPDYFGSIVDTEYQRLKSGLNFNGVYDKSKLYKYFFEEIEAASWEKAFMKSRISEKVEAGVTGWDESLYAKPENRSRRQTNASKFFFIRCLLGLPGEYTFLTETRQQRNKYRVIVKHNGIKRVSSPLMFKVFKKNLYLVSTWALYKEKYDSLLDNEFLLEFKNHEGSFTETIKVPEEFDINDFLEDCLPGMGFQRIGST